METPKITDIPYPDIIEYLERNFLSRDNKEKNYQTAEKLIFSGDYQFINNRIEDWIIAFNLSLSEQDIPTYDLLDILSFSKEDIAELSAFLNLEMPDRDRIIDILKYLHLLDMSIKMIPIKEIEQFLKDNNEVIFDNSKDNLYTTAAKLLMKPNIAANLPIIDYILAFNLNKEDIEEYKSSAIILSKDDQLEDLAAVLGLDEVNKDRIIRILTYAGKLVNDMNVFDVLPADVIINILLQLDKDTRNYLCNSSTSVKKICRNNLGEINRLLREKIANKTKLITSNYNYDQLALLDKVRFDNDHISAGDNFSFIIKENGDIYAFGFNLYGQLGLGDTKDRTVPTLIPKLENIIQISGGVNHTLALDNHGKVYIFGSDNEGQLGLLKESSNRPEFGKKLSIPLINSYLSNIVQVSAGNGSSLFLDVNGLVYGCGHNETGQLGIKSEDFYLPIIVNPFLKDIVAITTKSFGSLFLDINGKLYGCGNHSRRLGVVATGNNFNIFSPTLITLSHKMEKMLINRNNSIILTDDGIQVFGVDEKFIEDKNIVDISALEEDFLYLDNKGTIYDKKSHIIYKLSKDKEIAIVSGQHHTLMLSENGDVYSFGANHQGQLGIGNKEKKDYNFVMSIKK